MTKYEEIMNHLYVTEDMKERILKNTETYFLQEMARKKKRYRLATVVIGTNVALLFLAFGIYIFNPTSPYFFDVYDWNAADAVFHDEVTSPSADNHEDSSGSLYQKEAAPNPDDYKDPSGMTGAAPNAGNDKSPTTGAAPSTGNDKTTATGAASGVDDDKTSSTGAAPSTDSDEATVTGAASGVDDDKTSSTGAAPSTDSDEATVTGAAPSTGSDEATATGAASGVDDDKTSSTGAAPSSGSDETTATGAASGASSINPPTGTNPNVDADKAGVLLVKLGVYTGEKENSADPSKYAYTSFSSGFLVNEETLITCYHSVHFDEDEYTDLEVHFDMDKMKADKQRIIAIGVYRDQVVTASIIFESEESDLSILKLNQPLRDRKYIRISTQDVHATAPCYVLGFPGEGTVNENVTPEDVFVDVGLISKKMQYDGVDVIMHSATTRGGNSGGPLVNYAGSVIGIASFRFKASNSDADYYCAIGVNELIRVMDILGIQYSTD